MPVTVSGRVIERESQRGVPGLLIEAWPVGVRAERPLGGSASDADGAFSIEIEQDHIRELFRERTPELFFRVYNDDDALLTTTEDSVRWRMTDGDSIRIQVNLPRDETRDDRVYTVAGQVRGRRNIPISGVTVQVFDRDLGEEGLLGDGITSINGRYVVHYQTSLLRRIGKQNADLLVRVFAADDEGTELGTSEVLNAPIRATIDIDVDLEVDSDRSELERLLQRVRPWILPGRELEHLSDEEVEMLARRADIDGDHLKVLVRAARHVQETDLPLEPLYALFRGDRFDDLADLLGGEPDAIRTGLRDAVERSFIPNLSNDAVESMLARLDELRESRSSLDQLAPLLGIEPDSPLLSRLMERGIRSLDDIRSSGGIGYLEDLPVPADHPDVRKLEAHAQFGLLPTNISVSKELFEAGFESLDDIAETPRPIFVSTVQDRIKVHDATMIHTVARAQSLVLSDIVTGLRVNATSSMAETVPASLRGLVNQTCRCEACQSALSPLAYLADLLDYAVRHVRYKGNAITLSFLESRFHQPFGDFPKSCALLEQQVRQVRIAIEVLRKHLPVSVRNYTPRWYLERAYFMLLEQLGTSFDELREMRTWPDDRLRPFFERIGLYVDAGELPSDVLSSLLYDPTDTTVLTEAVLESIFGLRDTRKDPLEADFDAMVMLRRLDYLGHVIWPREDWPEHPAPDARPLIDPDIITGEDMVYSTLTTQWPRTPNRPIHLWEDRKRQIDDWLIQIDEVHQALNGDQEEIEAFITDQAFSIQNNRWVQLNLGLGITVEGFKQLRMDRLNGKDISAELDSLQLSAAAFDHVVAVWDVAGQGVSSKVLQSEWDELHAILIQRLKEKQYAAWRTEERAHDFTLSPRYFRLRETALSGGTEWRPRTWRSSVDERRNWEDTLRARVEQEEAVREGLRAMVHTVEEAFLHLLRHDLIIEVPGLGDKYKRLTQLLQIDFNAGVCQETTRIAQAIETIQGILFGARTGLLEDDISLDAPGFDEEWDWIGSYATWRAAMQVFLYPENALRPTLRREKSPAFDALIAQLRDDGRATPNNVRRRAEEYEQYFKDVCSLTAVAHFELPRRPSNDGEATFLRRGLVIAEAANSGRLYSSIFSWQMKPSIIDPSLPPVSVGPPIQTFWRLGPSFPEGSELVGAVRYRTDADSVQLALYARAQQGGRETVKVSSFDGRDWDSGQDSDSFPGLALSFAALWSISPDPTLPTGQTDDVVLTGEEILIPMDIDGDGRTEIVLFAPAVDANGRRSITLLREFEAALVVRWMGTIDGGWEPARQSPPAVVRTSTATIPPRAVERLLVRRNVGATNAQLGLLSLQPDGGLEVEAVTSTVLGSGGVPSWQVTKDAFYSTGDIDGDGRTEVVAVTYEQVPGGPPLPSVLEKTVCWVLRVSNTGFSVLARQDLRTPVPPGDPSPPSTSEEDEWLNRERWEGFDPIRRQSGSGVRYDFAVLAQHWVISAQSTEPWFGILRWDSASSAFQFSQIDPATIAGPTPWSLHGDEKFTSAKLTSTGLGDEIIVTSTNEIGVLRRGPNHVFTSTFKAMNELPPPQGSSTAPWLIQQGDNIIAADIDGDGLQELVILDATGANIGVLDWASAGALKLRWHEAQASSPGSGARHWRFSANPRCQVADVDGDGAKELITLAQNDAGHGRFGILRGIVPSRTEHLESLPLPLGPSGVTFVDLASNGLGQQGAARKAQIEAAYLKSLQLQRQRDLLYLDEAYYFLPIEIGLRLREGGYFGEALDWFRLVLDFVRPVSDRAIAYKLTLDATANANFERYADWLRDPLNPHAIAETRQYSYTKFTILAIVRCMLDYADSEFTRATSESIPRARELYLEALELLDSAEINGTQTRCDELIGQLEIHIGDGDFEWAWREIRHGLSSVTDLTLLEETVRSIQTVFASIDPLPTRLAAAQKITAEAVGASERSDVLASVLARDAKTGRRAKIGLLYSIEAQQVVIDLGREIAAAYSPRLNGKQASTFGLPDSLLHIQPDDYWVYVPAPAFSFCIPPNGIIEAARSHAHLQLHKIRTCRNIAGMEMPLEPYASPLAADAGLASVGNDGRMPALRRPNLRPLPYRYGTLIERTRQLVQFAQQIENSLLSTLQSADQARYEEIKARQDLALARAGVRLKDLQLLEANNGIRLAELQRNRAQLQTDHYEGLLAEGLSSSEEAGLIALTTVYALQMAGTVSPETLLKWAGAAVPAAQTVAELINTSASYERRAQEWDFQRQLSSQDVTIGYQQILLAQDQARVTTQDRAIAALQVDHAEVMLDFIETKKFGNAALYEWMSEVLGQVYRFFLQQATSMAQLAEAQLAFERQQIPPAFIQADYWEPPSRTALPAGDSAGDNARPADVQGMTGSARLLRSITELDQYAFETDRRKLQLTKTISLAQLDPFAFQRFRQSGVLRFATPMDLFDRDFPGHYLRLIKRVRTSIIALIPPTDGVRATLSTTGSSRVVIGGNTYQSVRVQRDPESVALTAPVNATGLFDLDPQPEMLVPFEGIGVDTSWELRLPKAANQFDYRTIADVLFTVDYTALDSYDYRQRVLAELEPIVSIDRAFSFRQEFPDQWYDLHNPDLTAAPFAVRLRIQRDDFPPNIDELRVRHIALYFAPAPTAKAAVPFPVTLTFEPAAQIGMSIGGAATVDAQGIASTRRGNAAPWLAITGDPSESPIGDWILKLSDDSTVRPWFTEEPTVFQDILLVMTLAGRTPPWPT